MTKLEDCRKANAMTPQFLMGKSWNWMLAMARTAQLHGFCSSLLLRNIGFQRVLYWETSSKNVSDSSLYLSMGDQV